VLVVLKAGKEDFGGCGVDGQGRDHLVVGVDFPLCFWECQGGVARTQDAGEVKVSARGLVQETGEPVQACHVLGFDATESHFQGLP
jgi:hypothetical protein